jgi:hypothetical protein
MVVAVGKPVLTQRDLDALRWVGEMYAVPMAVLGLVLNQQGQLAPESAETVARRTARRLERLGYADRRPMLGQTGYS